MRTEWSKTTPYRLALALAALFVLTVSRPVTAQTPHYKITDLGVLGEGSTDLSRATAANNNGQVVGYSHTATGNTHAFLQQGGKMFDLGTLPGTDNSEAYGINDKGQIVGASGVPDGEGGILGTAFLWTPLVPNGTQGSMVSLGTLRGGMFSAARGINNKGQVVGYSEDADETQHAFFWYPASPNGSSGKMTPIKTLSRNAISDENAAEGINDKGQIAGWSDDANGNPHAFLLTSLQPNNGFYLLNDLGTLRAGTLSVALGINAKGQVVGYSEDAKGTDHAFLWTPVVQNGAHGIMTSLHVLYKADTDSVARGLNDLGQVVGVSSHYDDHDNLVEAAFLWQPTTPNSTHGLMAGLDTLPNWGYNINEPRGINASGQVVGTSGTLDNNNNFSGVAFLWQPTTPNGTSGMVSDLGTLPNAYSAGNGLNALGQVVGSSSATPDGALVTDGFVWHDGVLTDTGSLIGIALNASGQVIGNLGSHAYLWQNGTTTDLGTLSGDPALSAVAINDAGQVLATAQGTVYGAPNGHAVLWQNGSLTDLTPSGDNFSAAAGFNASGQVVGMSGLRQDHIVFVQGHWVKRGFQLVWVPAHYENHWALLHRRNLLWSHDTATDLGALIAVSLNNAGQVAGNMGNHAFLWQNGTATDLGTLQANASTSAAALNNAGQVVGTSNNRAFVWQNGVMTDLNSLIPSDAGWFLVQASALNDAGQIVGTGTILLNGGTFTHAFLLTPSN